MNEECGEGKTHAALISATNIPLCNVPNRLISDLHNLVTRIPSACKHSHRLLLENYHCRLFRLFPDLLSAPKSAPKLLLHN